MTESSVNKHPNRAESSGVVLLEARTGPIARTIVFVFLPLFLVWFVAPVVVHWPSVDVFEVLYASAWSVVILYAIFDGLFARIRLMRGGIESRDFRARSTFYPYEAVSSFENIWGGAYESTWLIETSW